MGLDGAHVDGNNRPMGLSDRRNGARSGKRSKDAQAVKVQLDNPWPPGGTLGVITIGGRTFHKNTDCPGYRQGVRQAEKKGWTINKVEHIRAAAARDRGKGACRRCWPRA
ncbi:hypothetical protein [Micromonospora sp. CPCC 205556]|uniref:hypothetical protein n=1 Tax=Micromonospora sp. CPCC 205556 TaxID=3122398 RepID=UPI002FF17D6C